MKISESIVKFNVNKKNFTQKIEFKIYHNLPETKGMSFNDALHSWLDRTRQFTAQSLCSYILDKDIDGVFALTEEHYNKIIKEIEEEETLKTNRDGK